MSSQKCSNCGLVNWSDAASCKRCNMPLMDMNQAADFGLPTQPRPGGEKSATVLGLLMIGWGLLLLATGLFLLSFGHPSPVLVGGPAILITGIFLMRGSREIFVVYFAGTIVMSGWISTTDGQSAGIASFVFPGLVGLLVLKRRYPVLAGFLMVLSCVAIIGTFVVSGVLIGSAKVAWRDFRAPQTYFTVQMPAEPIVREPVVTQRGPYMMTKRIYESRVAGQGSTLYVIVNYMPPLPTDRVPYEQMLAAEVDAVASATSSTVVSKQSTMVSGRYTGLEVEMKPPANLSLKSPKTFVKLFMNSDQLYLMQITASETSELLAAKDTFLTPQFSY